MIEIKCKIDGCLEVFKTDEPVSAEARFICKNHPRAIQVAAVGRVYKPDSDESDSSICFQSHQFDKSLIGGTHMQRQKALKTS